MKKIKTIILLLLLSISLFILTPNLFAEEQIDPAYLAETKECQFTPELKELAKHLEYNPVKIYNWVYENIEYDFWRSSFGAQETYLTKRGNELDQCSLLITLLRISGIPARYVFARIDAASTATPFAIEAYVSMANYRGNNNDGIKSWVRLTPSTKDHRIENGIDLFPNGIIPEELNFDFDDYLSSLKQKTPLELFEEKVQQYLNKYYTGKALNDIPYKEHIIKKPASILPSSIPKMFSPQFTPPNTQFLTYAKVPNPDSGDVYLCFVANGKKILERRNIYYEEIVGKRFCLDFIPASENDAKIISSFGGIAKTPDYMAKLKPVLKLDGNIMQEGDPIYTGTYFTAYTADPDYTLCLGDCSPPLSAQKAGTFIQIGLYLNSSTETAIQKMREELKAISSKVAFNDATREEYLGRMGQVIIMTYSQRLDATIRRVEDILHLHHSGATPFIFLYTFPDETKQDNESKFLLHPTWNIDVRVERFHPWRRNAGYSYPELILLAKNLVLYGGSYNEGRIFEDWQDTPGASTVKGIMIANEQGIPVVTLTKADLVNGHLPILENETIDRLDDGIIQAIIAELNAGQAVTVPIRKIRYEGMVFSVYKSSGANSFGMMFNYDHGGAASPIVTSNPAVQPLPTNIPKEQTTQVINSTGGGNNAKTNDQEAQKATDGDPVNLVTGEFEHEENPDFDIKSRGGVKLDIIRKYKSQLIYNGPFGYGWAWNHSERLLIGTNGDLVFYNADRVPYYLTANGNETYQYPAGSTFVMRKEGSLYVLTEKDLSKIFFSDKGMLTRKENPNGNALTFEYDAQDQLIRIVDPLGRYLFLTYNGSGKISQISDLRGASCFYDYDGDDLIRFTDLEGNSYSYEYLKGAESNPDPSSHNKLLLHADGTNASTNFIDAEGHSITANGNAQISTSQSQFGGASALFDGAGDFLSLADSDDWNFGTGDFTIDFWVKINSFAGSSTKRLVGQDPVSGKEWWVYLEGDELGMFFYSGGTVAYYLTTGANLQINTWYHLAFVRNGPNGLIFVNDAQQSLNTIASFGMKDVGDCAGSLLIGAESVGNAFNGWLDELRISKGIARWTSDFTLPTAPDETSQSNNLLSNTKLLLYCDDTDAFNKFTDNVGHAVYAYADTRIDTTQSKFGGTSALFNGNWDRLSPDNSEDWNLSSGDFTIDFWVRSRSLLQSNGLFIERRDDNINECYINPDGSVTFLVMTADAELVSLSTPASAVSADIWYHIAIVRAENTYTIYINGIAKATLVDIDSPLSITSFSIGEVNNPASMYHLNGWLDEFRISKGIARWTSNFTPPTQAYTPDAYTKLLLHCDYDDVYTKFTDNKGHTVTPNGNVRPDIVQKKYGAASAFFDGSGDYLSIPDSDDWNFGSDNFTIDFWVKFNNMTNQSTIISQVDDGAHYWNLIRQNDNSLSFSSEWGIGEPNRAAYHTGNTGMVSGTWYHVAFERDGPRALLYINGVAQPLTEDFAFRTKIIPNYAAGLEIGRRNMAGSMEYLNGWLDELRITKGTVRWTTDFTPPTEQYNASQDILSHPLEYQENDANGHNMSKYTLPNGDYLEIGYYKNDTVSFHRNKKDEVFSFQYSRLNRYAETWNEEGYYRKVFYNENNDVIRVTTREKTVELKEYDNRHNMTSYTDPNGYTTRFTYDVNRNLISKTNALDQTWRYIYDLNFNKPIRITDPAGNAAIMEYDTYGNLVKVFDAQGSITTYAYDAYGNITKSTDAKGAFQENIFDGQGLNPIEIVDKNENRSTYLYDEVGNLISETDPVGNATKYEYNRYNQKTKITDALDNVTRYEYDSNRLLTKLIEANGAITQNIYDTVRDMVAGAKILQTIDPLGNKEEYDYDKLGNMISKKDKNENIALFKYDEMNRLIETTDPFQNTIRNTYDGNGNLTSITDKRGNTAKFNYDGANRKTSVADPYDNKTQYEYDKNGNLAKETNATGIVIKYEYDSLNRLIKKTAGYGLTTPRIVSFEYNVLGQMVKSIDPLGNYALFEYDANGNKTKEAFFDSSQKKLAETSYVYDNRNLLIKKVDPNGNAWQFEYDKLKRKTAEIDPLGNKIEYAYDKVGNIRVIKDQLQNITAFTYGLRKEKITETDPYGNEKQFTYDNNGNLITITDELGNTTQYGYDSLNRRIAETDALGATTLFDYDENSNLKRKTFPFIEFYEYSSSCEYDRNNRLSKQMQNWQSNSLAETFEYDVIGRLTKTTDARGAITVNQYNEFSEITAITNALGEKNTKEYDTLGRLVKTTDARDIITLAEYDAFGRVTKITQASGTSDEAITTFEYDANGNKIKETNALGAVTTFTYDTRNLLTQKTLVGDSGLPDILFQYEYDAKGQTTKIIEPKGNATLFTYDKLGRKICETNPEGDAAAFNYDKVGNLISEITPEGRQVSHEYDAAKRRTKTIADGKDKAFFYDARGNVIKETDFNGMPITYLYYFNRVSIKSEAKGTSQQITTTFNYDANMNIVSLDSGYYLTVRRFAYDLLNRRIAETDADQSAKRFNYDLNGNLIKITKRNGEVIDQTFDSLNRLTEVRAAGSLQQQFTYDKLSRMTKAIDYNGGRKTHTVDYEYDRFNRVSAEIHDGKRLTKQYDANSNPIKLTYPSGRVIDKTYTALNLVKDVWHQSVKVSSLAYDKDARLKTATFANGITQNLSYNAKGLEETRKYTQGGQTIFGSNTAYDPEGNALQETIAKNAETIIKSYSYDSLNRVTQEASAAYQNSWGYDAYNNLISTNQNGYQETRSVNYDNEYTQINTNPVTYDADGNLTSYSGKEYLYDWANRLIEAKQGGATVATYTYDALNRRVTKYSSSDAKTVTFIHDANQVIEEYFSSFGSSPDKLYVYADYIDDPLIMEMGGERYYYLKDRQYNITALTNEAGAVVERYDYNAYGLMAVSNASGVPQAKSAIGNYYGYTGRYFDTETGLWYYRNRSYTPELNRFLQRDPSGYVDGINLYAYVKNNPLRYLDAFGLKAREKKSWWSSVTDFFRDTFVPDYTSGSQAPDNWQETWKKENNTDVFIEEAGIKEDLAPFVVPVMVVADTAGDIASTGYDTYQFIKNPTKENLHAIGFDAGALALPLVSAPIVKAGAKFVSEFAAGAKTVNKIGEKFVHIAPKNAERIITRSGLKQELSTYVTKSKNITGKSAADFEKILYNKELQPLKQGKFSEGAVIFEIDQRVGKPSYKGLTNRSNGIPQWKYEQDIPPEYLTKIGEVD